MTLSVPRSVVASEASAHRRPALLSGWSEIAVAAAAGGLLLFLLTLPQAVEVWRSGMFFNPDDAMRTVEIRDFAAGQGWFDLVPHRLSPLHPFAMHWSRLVDLMLLAVERGFELVLPPAWAERAMRLVVPAALGLTFLALAAAFARERIGRGGAIAAALLAAGALDLVATFIPGHIHHHGLQLTLLMAMVAAFCTGLDPARFHRLALAGGLGALSLGVNLQSLPFLAIVILLLVLFWVERGEIYGQGLRWFALGLVATASLVFLAQVPPSRWLEPSCDAFSSAHVLAVGVGGAMLFGLGCVAAGFASPLRRFIAAGLVGLMLILVMKVFAPGCLGDPYAGVDPLLQTRWLADVSEAMPLGRLLWRDPAGAIPILVTLLAGLVSSLWAAIATRDLERRRWIVLAALCLVGVVGSCWEVRVAASAEAVGLFGCAFVLCRAIQPRLRGRPFATLTSLLLGLASSQAGWAAILPHAMFAGGMARPPAAGLLPIEPRACFAPEAFAGLAALPPGLVLSTIDPGSLILAYTWHSVVAAAYHRNTSGNRLALLAFVASAEEARGMILEAGVRYVALCAASAEVHGDVARNPDGLAARLMRGAMPSWLRPVAENPGPIRVFEVVPAS